jgi:developmental checkpoint coupling sporulation initiation to replication initiation
MMAILSDEMLLESYYLAIDLKLEHDFITLLLAEIHKRRLQSQHLIMV